MRGTGGDEINDDNPGRADSGNGTSLVQNPCTLVSRAQAQAIVGTQIATPQEAPLGPTCIYKALGAESFVTVTVESADFAKIRSQIHNRTRLTIRGHAAYCGDYGRTTTFVPLSADRVLDVAAPCTVGMRFAEKALPHIET